MREESLTVGLQFDAETSTAQPQIHEINEELKNVSENANDAGKKLGSIPNQIVKNTSKATDSLKLIDNQVLKIKQSIGTLNKFLNVSIVGVGSVGAFALKQMINTEYAVRKVRTISHRTFQEIERDAKSVARTYGVSIGQVLEGNYQLVSSMGDVADSYQVQAAAAQLSVAGFTSYTNALNGLITVMNGYKLSASEAARVGDLLLTVQNKGIATTEEIQAYLPKLTVAAANSAVSIEDLCAAMATITANKVPVAETVTYLNALFKELNITGSKVSVMFKNLTGESFKNYLQEGHSLLDALLLLERELQNRKMSSAELFSSDEAGKAFINLTGDNVNKFVDSINDMKNSMGTVKSSFLELEKTIKRKLERLMSKMTEIALQIGKVIYPYIEKFLDAILNLNLEKVYGNKLVKAMFSFSVENMLFLKAVSQLMKSFLSVTPIMVQLLHLQVANAQAATIMTSALGSFGKLGLIYTALYAFYKLYASNTRSKEQAAKTIEENSKPENKVTFYRAAIEDINKYGVVNPHIISDLFHPDEKDKAVLKEIIGIARELEDVKEGSTRQKELLAKAVKILEFRSSQLNSNDGYLSAPPGSKMTEQELRELYAKAGMFYRNEEQQKIVNAFQNEISAKEQYVKFFRTSQKDALREYASIARRYAEQAFGAKDKPKAQEYFKIALNYEARLKALENNDTFKNIVNKYKKVSSKNATEESSYKRVNAEIDNVTEFIEQLKELDSKKHADLIKEATERKEYLLKLKKTHEDELKAKEEYNKKIQSFNEMSNSLSSLFSTIGDVTGSKTIGSLGNLIGRVSGFGSLSKFGGMSSITGMFAKDAAGKMAGLSAGMASIGALAGGATAAIGAVSAISGLVSGKGKKQKAKIDARNQREQEEYKKQTSAMQELTKALEANTEKIKSFTDRMLTDVAKNPTLKMISGGKWNFMTFYDSMINGKHFNNINAVEKGSERYSKGWGRHGHKDTYTNVSISSRQLLKHLGWDNTNIDTFTASQIKQLDEMLENVDNSTLRRATGRDLTTSNINEWKKQVHIFAEQLRYLEKEQNELYNGATLESFNGINYREKKQLVKEYTEQFKQLGIEGKEYAGVIEEMAKNNQVLVTSMQDVRTATLDAFMNGDSGFVTSAKSYFEKIIRNASSVVYDVTFSEIDRYMSDQFEAISRKLLEIKKSGNLDFTHLFDNFDFGILTRAEVLEQQAKKSLDAIKQQLLNSGVSLSIINKILPQSDFTDRLNSLKDALSSAMNEGLKEHSFFDFTKTLGQSLYDSTKGALVKAFSESNLYQGMIQKFIKAEDYQGKLERAGSFKEALSLSEKIMQNFAYELEANGLGGFDAINNIRRKQAEDKLGNAYYQDKNANVEVKITNNFYKEIFGLPDFKKIIRETTEQGIQEFLNRPRVLA